MAGTYKIIEEDLRKEIIKRFKAGVNMSNIAESLKMNRRQIRKVLIEEGLYKIETHKDKKEKLEESKEKILNLYDCGYSIKRIKKHSKKVE